MDTVEQTIEHIKESLTEQENTTNMAPLEMEDSESGYVDQKDNRNPKQKVTETVDSIDVAWSEIETQRVVSTDGEMEDAEDGEILEDGEIASDQDVDVNTDSVPQENMEEEVKSESNKGSPAKSQSGAYSEEQDRRGHSKKEQHPKRRWSSKEDSHKDKQKKKRYKKHSEYEKDGNEYQGQRSSDRCEKGERKRDRSPPVPYQSPSHGGEDRSKHDKDGERKHRSSGETRHRGSHKDRDGEQNKDRPGDGHVTIDKNRQDRERHGKDKKTFNDHESPPGIYDSPSDEEYRESRFEGKKPWNMADPAADKEFNEAADTESVRKNKRKPNKRKNNFEQRQLRSAKEGADDFEEEELPIKKKPLLQTPMEERPICKFYKEGKCQKGSECPFNHDFQVQKRFELCKYHLQSQCRKREECVFMHEDFPCKYFHTGSTCYQGDNCKFSHDQLTPETEIALKSILNERDELLEDHNVDMKKHRKKGLLGDQPSMSEEEVQRKLEHIKYIPSIFDIQTHAPYDNSPSKLPMGQSPNACPPGFYQDNMSTLAGMNGPHMRFNLPANQGTQSNRLQFGPGGHGIDGPLMGPPMVSGPGLLGPTPSPMMSGPGMQGPPMGPPMSQAAALVGAILRAAPMFQQFRGPLSQGQVTSLSNNMMGDTRFLASNLMVPSPNIVQSVNMSIMSQSQVSVMQDGNQQSLMSEYQQQNITGQGHQQQNLVQGQINTVGSMRDPRKMAATQNDPRLNRISPGMNMHDLGDMDMRSAGNCVKENVSDEDLQQDEGDRTPQQGWDDMEEVYGCDNNTNIAAHLPPKQREMFLRIRQHALAIKSENSAQQNHVKVNKQMESKSHHLLNSIADDDKWYSSDEEDDRKPDISNILQSQNQTDLKLEPGTGTNTMPSAINVMQMINKIKHSTSTSCIGTLPNRLMDPRKQVKPQEQAIIESHDGDCPWKLYKVLCVKQRIPDSVDLQDEVYKNDPRVQKILKLQELESGKVIDHTKAIVNVKKEPNLPKLPELLDPTIFKEKKNNLVRPELTPFVGSNPVKLENFGKPVQRPPDPRLKSGSEMLANKPADPRALKSQSIQGFVGPSSPNCSADHRISHKVSNSTSFVNSVSLPSDPRFSRQDSQEHSMSGDCTPPLDPRVLSRQSSNDPRSTKSDTVPSDFCTYLSRSVTARLSIDSEAESVKQSFLKQVSQPNTSVDRESISDIVLKPKLDYRNDPRFKRKPISESNLSPETIGKCFTGQRKSSTEYSSPLGVESSKVEDLGYNSYNRPRAPKPHLQQSLSQNSSVIPMLESVPIPTSDLTTNDILDSLQIMSPPAIGKSLSPDKNLKDIFKTIDPTASPFC